MRAGRWMLVTTTLILITLPATTALAGGPEPNLGVCELDAPSIEEPITPVATLLAACCFPDDTCENLPRAQCFEDGGWPHRVGTYCASIECHYPMEVACCLPDGTCEELQPRICNRQGGQPHYKQGDCSDVECDAAP